MTALPSGRYLTCVHQMDPTQGGTTRALLARTRIFADRGVEPAVLLFSPVRDLEQRRADFLDLGLVSPSTPVLDIYEHYRDTPWDDAPTGEPLADLQEYATDEETLPDGSPWRTEYRLPGDTRIVHDYRRPDGSIYLRVPSFSWPDKDSWPQSITRVGPGGEVCGSFTGLGQWFRRWVRDVAGDAARTFVFIDSRQLVPHLVPLPRADIHLIYVLHNNHLRAPRRWDSPTTSGYEPVLRRIGRMSAFVCLTDRQRQDIGLRVGATSNMYVVPNPVHLPHEAVPAPRDPRRVTMLSRLVMQKRLEDAVRALELVVGEVPDARLDIYGAGPLRTSIQLQVERAGLVDNVTLHGHDSDAVRALSSSSALLLTSRYEGYPLATLESLAHGCPVVAYDIPYGPREQVTDGVDGFLVEDGDVEELARRIVILLRDPDLVERMGRAGRVKAAEHGVDRFVSDWADVLESVVQAAPRRTTVRGAELVVRGLDITRRRTPRIRPGEARPAARPGDYPGDRLLHLSCVLKIRGRGKGGLGDATLELLGIGQVSGEVVSLPLTVDVAKRRMRVAASFPLADVFSPVAPPDEEVRLVLRLVWRNSAVDRPLAVRPSLLQHAVQLAYAADGSVGVTRFARTHDGRAVERPGHTRRLLTRRR